MKRIYLLAIMMFFILTSSALAQAPRNWGWCGGCAGIFADMICSGTPVTISGQVVGVSPGRGYILNVNGENVIVSGMGPVWYWKRLGVLRPRVGDIITVDGYQVTLRSGETVIFAINVTTYDGRTVQLRDPNTCCPLWFRKNFRNPQNFKKNNFPLRQNYYNQPYNRP
ncbi:hypothetical protein [Thermodesulfatator autotrophicus]|uniref:DNA-binding protein n=1 Tax=Thermodesulfatator autotrophicus TaxID=1795632 RepID=A0A177E665_9BACT|nr:hypothetical protein [Thermodesulfatator autotrophicus]OAG27385.1 hypothetical protein TH606_07240 [Thermodesulfatator autotrophicus]